MSAKHLGVPFDIHCGGIDHIPIHHTNEIAQAEAVFNKNLANFWLHGEFLTLEGGKMAKSEGNIITLESLIKKEFNPLSYRYLCLSGHYRSKISFSWEALKSAQNALDNLYEKIRGLNKSENKKSGLLKDYIKKFSEYINDDLNTPKAIALMWETVKSKELSDLEKYNILIDFDKVLGLGLSKIKKSEIPQEIIKIVNEREKYRKENNWQKSDELREKIKSLGFIVEDTAEGPKIKK
jgi:cysteinyl-tRNA synthetase